MTCEDCLHYNLCKNQYGATDYFDEDDVVMPDVEAYCGNAEDKRRFLELPCRVGDEVWFIKAAFSLYAEPKVEKISKIEIYDTDILFRARTRVFNNTALGKTVFLTYEEAERALKEAKA